MRGFVKVCTGIFLVFILTGYIGEDYDVGFRMKHSTQFEFQNWVECFFL